MAPSASQAPPAAPHCAEDPGWVPMACPTWLLWVPGLPLAHSRSRQADTHRAAEMAPAFKRQDPGEWDLRPVSLDSRWSEMKKPHTWTVQVEGCQKALRQGCGGHSRGRLTTKWRAPSVPPPPAPHPVPGDSRTRWEERETQEGPKTAQVARRRLGGCDVRDGGGGG